LVFNNFTISILLAPSPHRIPKHPPGREKEGRRKGEGREKEGRRKGEGNERENRRTGEGWEK